jgi:hypothetical protein
MRAERVEARPSPGAVLSRSKGSGHMIMRFDAADASRPPLAPH